MNTEADRVARLGLETLVDLLRLRAEEDGGTRAFTFLLDGEDSVEHATYAELDARARCIAAVLQDQGARGGRVLLLYPPGIEYIAAYFGCLYAGAVAIPAYPPPEITRRNALARLIAIAENSEASTVLTIGLIERMIAAQRNELTRLAACRWIATDRVRAGAEAWTRPAGLSARDLAFLQYTSGSTGSPKAVMVSHGALLHNLSLIATMWQFHDQSAGVFWLPPYHDMGLIGGILTPIFARFLGVLMSPLAFIKRPVRWLRAIGKYRATTSGGPTFGFDLCSRAIAPADREGLDLSTWETAFVGSEPITRAALERFADAFAPCGFRRGALFPCYGLAEATLMVSAAVKGEGPRYAEVDATALGKNQVRSPVTGQRSVPVVSCGRMPEQDVRIVDPDTLRECPPDVVGEIWIAGGSVASGYWKLPDETERTFDARIAGAGAGPYLRTGDLGFVRRGELHVTGRIKEVIILRGRKHYPQDIEQTVASCHPGLRSDTCAAFAVSEDGFDRLVVVVELDSKRALEAEGAAAALLDAIRREISTNHEIELHQIALVPRRALPRTSSGKLQRALARSMLADGKFEIVAQRIGPVRSPAAPAIDPERAAVAPALADAAPALADATGSAARADAIIAWLRDYAEYRMSSRLMDERRSIAPHIVLDLGNRGALAMEVPEEYGGPGLGRRDTLRVIEQLAAIDLTVATFAGVNNSLGVRPILHFAQPAARAALLPLMARGRELASFAMTEPGAGSNPNAIATRATPDGRGGWTLRGTKIWIGTSAWSGVVNVFAQTIGLDGAPGGITGFAVRQDRRSVRPGAEALTMGMRGMVQNTLHLDDHPVGPGDVLGEVGRGLAVAQDAMMFTRLALGATSLGAMKRCAQLMVRYAERRTIATGRLLDNPVTRARLHDLACAITALEQLVARMADRLDGGARLPDEAYCAIKSVGPELLWRAADRLMQLLGGRGYMEANIAPQILRDARVLRILEGPTETMQMFVGSSVAQGSPGFAAFLRDDLGSRAVAERLEAAGRDLAERGGRFGDRVSEARWGHAALGELAGWAALWAAAQRASGDAGREAAAWAERGFERTRARALEPGHAVPDGVALASVIGGYRVEIGDVEQSAPGEEVELDPLLRREPPVPAGGMAQAVPSPAEDAAPAEAARPAPGERGEHARLERWMRAWVAAHGRMAVEDVDLDQPLATYGLDSVAAITVMAELEQLVGQPLEPTLVWSYPSIRALAAHLIASGCRLSETAPAGTAQVTGSATAGSGTVAPVAAEKATPAPGGGLSALLDQIESLSEEEVAALLRGSWGQR